MRFSAVSLQLNPVERDGPCDRDGVAVLRTAALGG